MVSTARSMNSSTSGVTSRPRTVSGTWNGVTCQIVIANDNATSGASATGNATATGNYCVRVYDVGKLTQSVGYQVTVTHF